MTFMVDIVFIFFCGLALFLLLITAPPYFFEPGLSSLPAHIVRYPVAVVISGIKKNRRTNHLVNMRHPSTLGRMLVTSSIFALVAPLISALIFVMSSISIYLMDTLSTSLKSSLNPLCICMSMASIIIDITPTLIASGLTAYIGCCIGFVGLAHLHIVHPDQRQRYKS